jgi:hypothetical protein
MMRRIYPDNTVMCPEREGLVEVEECEQCPFYTGKKIHEGRWVKCLL